MSVVRLARLAREGLERTQNTIQRHVRQLPDQIEQMGETLADRISHIPIVGRFTSKGQHLGEGLGSARSARSLSPSGTHSARSSDRVSVEPTAALPQDINDQLDWDKAYIQVPLRRGSTLTQIDFDSALGKGAVKTSPGVVEIAPLEQKLSRRRRGSNSAQLSDDISATKEAAPDRTISHASDPPTEYALPTTYVPEYAGMGRSKSQAQEDPNGKTQSPNRSGSLTRKKYVSKHETVPWMEQGTHQVSNSQHDQEHRSPKRSPANIEPEEPPAKTSPKHSPQRFDIPECHQGPDRSTTPQPTHITHAAPLRLHSQYQPRAEYMNYDGHPVSHYAEQLNHNHHEGVHGRVRATSQPPRPREYNHYGDHTRVTPILEHRDTGQRAALPSFDVRDTWARHGRDVWHGELPPHQPNAMRGWTSTIDEEHAQIRRMKEEAAHKLRELDNKERQLMADLGIRSNHPMGASMPPGIQISRNPYYPAYPQTDRYMQYNEGCEPGDIPLLTLYPIGDRSRKVFSTNKRLTTNEMAPVAWKTVNLDGTSAPVMQVPHIMPTECVHSTIFN